MTPGELEASTLEAERAQASKPPDVSRQLRFTAQAEADAWLQSADAAARQDHTEATNAKALAGCIAVERRQLEAANARYEQWSAATTSTRETGAKARAELERCDLARQPDEPSQPQAANEPGADITTVNGVQCEHQVTVTTDELRFEQTPQSELTPQNEPAAAREPGDLPRADYQEVRFAELLAHAAAAARCIVADRVQREARAEYAARVQREAQAQPEPTLEVQAQYDVEMEL